MTDHPIAPDLTGDVPRCQTSCPSYVCHSAQGPGTVCLPHVRHLKLLSERRCDGCANWGSPPSGPPRGFCLLISDGFDGMRYAHESCSRWVRRG